METAPESVLDEAAPARAVIYRFASEAFRYPRLCEAERVDPEGLCSAFEVARELGAPPELADLGGRCRALLAGGDAVVRDHSRLIGPTPRAGATPYETEWLGAAGDLLQFHQISDIAAFYKAFGLELAQQCDERADHLAVELAFLHFLCVKQAFAEDGGLDDLTAVCREVQRQFLADHVARWTPAFCTRLERADPRGFYGTAARLVRLWIADECRRLGVAPGDPCLAPSETSTTLEDCSISCQASSSCAARGCPAAGDAP